MERIFEVSRHTEFGETFDVVIIRRKPSEIPCNIDLELLRTCGWAFMNGPDNYVRYHCRTKGALTKATKLLTSCGWKQIPAASKPIVGYTCQHCGGGHLGINCTEEKDY